MSKRALIYLVAGVLCAVAAVLAANKYLVSQSADGTMPLTPVLVASKHIEFGTPLKLPGEGQGGNVGFAQWPEQHVPEGAITSDDEVKEKNLVAQADFVRDQPILRPLVVPEEEMVPEGMYLEYIAGAEGMELISPGDRIDIFKIIGQRDVEPFIRCVRVYSVGAPPGTAPARGAAATANRIYVLLPVDVSDLVLDAKVRYKLMIRRSVQACRGEGVEVVGEAEDVRAQEAARESSVAEGLLENGEFQTALDAFKRIVEEYPDLPVSESARLLIGKCREALAAQSLQEAQLALERRDFGRCIELCATVTKECPEAKEAAEAAAQLAEKAREDQQEYQQEMTYRELHEKLEKSLDRGNMPLVRELLEQMAEEFGGYQPPASLKSPDEVREEITAQLKDWEAEFERDKRIFQYFLNEGNRDKALERFGQLKEHFPDHPYIQDAERQIGEKGWLE